MKIHDRGLQYGLHMVEIATSQQQQQRKRT